MYLPAPRGPRRMSECGRRPAAMAARRLSTVGRLPMKSWKVAGSGTGLDYLLGPARTAGDFVRGGRMLGTPPPPSFLVFWS